jgi:26S proteasome regulatory subunit N8
VLSGVPDGILVPFEEDDKDPSVWFLDHTYIDDMNSMFKKINGLSQLRRKNGTLIHNSA